MRKNSFLTFCFAMMPGAGQMYVGLMKKGVCLMSLFFGICLIGCMDVPYMLMTIPVIWFYSFFDAINYNNLPAEKKELIEDKLDIDKSIVAFIGLILVLSIVAGGFHSFGGFLKLILLALTGIVVIKMISSDKSAKTVVKRVEEESWQN